MNITNTDCSYVSEYPVFKCKEYYRNFEYKKQFKKIQ